MARTMPKQKPGKSETVVRTPPEFIRAVKSYLDIDNFVVDLAACDDNAVAPHWVTKGQDALSLRWWFEFNYGWCWLNPPYDKMRPWVKKCAEQAEMGVRIALLVPASIGSNWWREYVHNKARVLNVGRLYFLDKNGDPIVSPKTGKPTPYPKDLCLVLYGDEPGYDYFDWKDEL